MLAAASLAAVLGLGVGGCADPEPSQDRGGSSAQPDPSVVTGENPVEALAPAAAWALAAAPHECDPAGPNPAPYPGGPVDAILGMDRCTAVIAIDSGVHLLAPDGTWTALGRDVFSTSALLARTSDALWVSNQETQGAVFVSRLDENGWTEIPLGPEVLAVTSMATQDWDPQLLVAVEVAGAEGAGGAETHWLWEVAPDGSIVAQEELPGLGLAIASDSGLDVVACYSGGGLTLQGFTPDGQWERQIDGGQTTPAIAVQDGKAVALVNDDEVGVPVGVLVYGTSDSGSSWEEFELGPETYQAGAGSVAIAGERVVAGVVSRDGLGEFLGGELDGNPPWTPVGRGGEPGESFLVSVLGSGAWLAEPDGLRFVEFDFPQ
ncbi:MAG: hypothetical protein LBT54_03740 [Bifidobacteriaceae bacterium]|nr:hypothetical protein [Bifidobacteriaceae bacterium]